MSQFDYYLRPDGWGYLLDCQSEAMEHFDNRFVVPLIPRGLGPEPARILNPVFIIAGEPLVMTTQFASAIPITELGDLAGSLADYRYDILNALDFLIS